MKLLRMLFVGILTLSISGISFANFSDVDASETYDRAIDFLQEEGIVEGYEDGSFRPGQTLNRAELLKILFEAVEVSEAVLDTFDGQGCFVDVPSSQWFTKYVCYAKDRGIVQGYADGTFKPGQDVNVVEALKMTLAVFGFDFSEDTDPWYRGVVFAASDRNLIPHDIDGFGNGMTRGQMADLVTRALNEQEGILEDYLESYGDGREYEVVDFNVIKDREERPEIYPAVMSYAFFGLDGVAKNMNVRLVPNDRLEDVPEGYQFVSFFDDYLVDEGSLMWLYVVDDGEDFEEDRSIAETFSFDASILDELNDLDGGFGCVYTSDYDFSMYFSEAFSLESVVAQFDRDYFVEKGYASDGVDSLDFSTEGYCGGFVQDENDPNGGRVIHLQAK